jgi:Peptidase propeptide and YPEB domain
MCSPRKRAEAGLVSADTSAGGMKMKFALMAFAAGMISGSTLALAETPVSPAEAEKIKATIEIFGCTGGKIEKADFGYEVDDVKCKDGEEYEIKLDPNFKLIVMTRD